MWCLNNFGVIEIGLGYWDFLCSVNLERSKYLYV